MILVRRPGGTDRHGDPLPDEPDRELSGAFVAPRSSTESTNLRNTVIVGLSLFADYGADVRATDQVVITDGPDAGTYEVEGGPGHWENPMTGWRAGVEVALRKVAG